MKKGYLVERPILVKTNLSRWQRLARSIASITIAFPANHSGSPYHARHDSLTPFGEASSLYYSEKCESPKCV